MAWEDRTPFDAINFQYNIKETEVIQLMRSNLKTSSFKMWRKRVTGRKSKHGFHDQYRLSMILRNLEKMDPNKKMNHRRNANEFMSKLT